MGIPFDHTQYALDSNMIMGATETQVDRTGTFTDSEFWRSYINPGMVGVMSYLEAELAFNAYTGGSSTVTYKWEIKPHGQSSWVTIFTSTGATWPTNIERKANVIFEPSGDTEDDVPFELRLLITTSASDTVHVIVDNTNISVRVVGESL